jgi:hypothetical protein
MGPRILAAVLLVLCACSKPDPASEQAKLEREFELLLTNATLVGSFSIGSRITEDRYKITKVTHVAGENWLIHSQIGKKDISIPVPVKVRWAGDTPMIMLTDVGLPGMSTYSARVLFYRGQYAGTWSSPKHGGQMWGKVEH